MNLSKKIENWQQARSAGFPRLDPDFAEWVKQAVALESTNEKLRAVEKERDELKAQWEEHKKGCDAFDDERPLTDEQKAQIREYYRTPEGRLLLKIERALFSDSAQNPKDPSHG